MRTRIREAVGKGKREALCDSEKTKEPREDDHREKERTLLKLRKLELKRHRKRKKKEVLCPLSCSSREIKGTIQSNGGVQVRGGGMLSRDRDLFISKTGKTRTNKPKKRKGPRLHHTQQPI